jgi:hypothetical protein
LAARPTVLTSAPPPASEPPSVAWSGTRESRAAELDGRERLRAAELAALTTTVTSSFAG